MIGSSIDLSLENIWRSWRRFRAGKKLTADILRWESRLLNNLRFLQESLTNGVYQSGGYMRRIIKDNKRRDIAIAGVRDRVVHRLVYDYLVEIFDQHFIYDVWSCRPDKGLIAGLQRAQKFLWWQRREYVWRADITKFFDSVNQTKLLFLLKRRVVCPMALQLCEKIIDSYGVGGGLSQSTRFADR